jgi:hypothetical protein
LQVVRIMLAAVHQLTDALAALRVTLELTQQQQQQHTASKHHHTGQQASTPAASPLAQPGQTSQPGQTGQLGQLQFDPGWHSWLLFDQLAALVHADISGVLTQLQQLAALVGQAVRQPASRELKGQLQRKVGKANVKKADISLSSTHVSGGY